MPYKNLTVKVKGDFSNLTRGIKDAKKQAKRLRKELKKSVKLVAKIRS